MHARLLPDRFTSLISTRRKSIQKWGITSEATSRAVVLHWLINCFISSLYIYIFFFPKPNPTHSVLLVLCTQLAMDQLRSVLCPSPIPQPSQLQAKACPRGTSPVLPAWSGKKWGMLRCGLGTEDREITAGMWGEGASFYSLLGSGQGQPGLWTVLAVSWEKSPCPLRRKVMFELCLKAQPFLT